CVLGPDYIGSEGGIRVGANHLHSEIGDQGSTVGKNGLPGIPTVRACIYIRVFETVVCRRIEQALGDIERDGLHHALWNIQLCPTLPAIGALIDSALSIGIRAADIAEARTIHLEAV